MQKVDFSRECASGIPTELYERYWRLISSLDIDEEIFAELSVIGALRSFGEIKFSPDDEGWVAVMFSSYIVGNILIKRYDEFPKWNILSEENDRVRLVLRWLMLRFRVSAIVESCSIREDVPESFRTVPIQRITEIVDQRG
ncbi:hypothetical protein [Acuticoccus kandeliae]|uniref:hypothetical protein n=1 Tax=Acuticoccus kandeliae TaxID=2073160 RepID=UPI0013004120|nr:hypothetical protein [Acuticoccus kandeliae]